MLKRQYQTTAFKICRFLEAIPAAIGACGLPGLAQEYGAEIGRGFEAQKFGDGADGPVGILQEGFGFLDAIDGEKFDESLAGNLPHAAHELGA